MSGFPAKDYLYYVNGEFTPSSQAAIGLNDLGLVRGYGVFEVLRTYGPRPFGLRAHLERLQHSAMQIDLALPWPLDEIEATVQATLAHNDPTDVTIRIIVTGGASSNFLIPEDRPSLLVMLAPVKPYAAHFYRDGATLITFDCARFMPTVKSLNYITALMGQRKARAAGAAEALYCDAGGIITECTTSNFFIFKGDQLITPVLDVLPGITRAAALEVAGDLFELVERPIQRDELAETDEAFITSTTKEIMPIVHIDGQRIGGGSPGVRTQRLSDLFHEYVAHGLNPSFHHA
ncbi:aminotransferase class IV [Caldilinea sp.]|uniref:aminotransferase class IV n=1 Tax=Caldilinea sp. TaxID=2293560 RepID=UPI002BB0FE4F|nr:aminotransferase class IV [Caldilinea sp.]HRA67710.1 aminotransferase class IV [Caldilinea sp.]